MNNEPLNFSNIVGHVLVEPNELAKPVAIDVKLDSMSLAKSLVEQLHRLNELQARLDTDLFINDGPDGQLENIMTERIRNQLNEVCEQPERLLSLGAALRYLFNSSSGEYKYRQQCKNECASDFSPSTQNAKSESHRGWIKIGWNGLSRSTNLYVVRRDPAVNS
jgi:hypothetical protein